MVVLEAKAAELLYPAQVLVYLPGEELQVLVLVVLVLAVVLSDRVLPAVASFPQMMKAVGQPPEVAVHRALAAMSVQVCPAPKVVPHSALVWPCRSIHGDRLVPLGGSDGVNDEIEIHTGQTRSFSPIHP